MEIVLLAIVLILIVIVAFIIKKVGPRVKVWRERRMEIAEFRDERQKLMKLQQEVLYHMNWARDRGDTTDMYEQELAKIKNDIYVLNSKHPGIELSDI